jgi:homoserine dehydrogenase
MEKSGKPYADALKEAQQKGYAETNPTADVSGSDAEAKLLLLSAVVFGLQLPPGTTWRKGIEDIHTVDFRYAGRTGSSTIKHLAVAKRTGQAVEVFVSPALVARDNFLAGIAGATNAICFKAKKSGGRASSQARPGSAPRPATWPPLSPCSETSASWRAERAGSPDYRV